MTIVRGAKLRVEGERIGRRPAVFTFHHAEQGKHGMVLVVVDGEQKYRNFHSDRARMLCGNCNGRNDGGKAIPNICSTCALLEIDP